MRRAIVLVAAVTAALIGCATFGSVVRSDADKRFDAGVRALENGDYATARTHLAWVAEHFNDKTVGQRALLIMAALEMDPRNPTRRTDVGSDMAASFLRLPERDTWVDPIAQTLYLQSIELGAAEERAERAERDAEQHRERELPKLPGPTVSARIKAVEADRDRLAQRVTALEAQLADKDRELERIRKTIKP
jgi:hypothetical protein